MQDENEFNPYRKLLGISARITKPNYYQLLGVEDFESDTDIISNAADARLMALKTFQLGQYSAESQRLMNEVSQARVCLVNPDKRAEYDAQLRREMEAQKPVPKEVPVIPTGTPVPPVVAGSAPVPPLPPEGTPVPPPIAGEEKKNVVPPPIEEPSKPVVKIKTTSKVRRNAPRLTEPKTPRKPLPTGAILGVVGVLVLLVGGGIGLHLRSQSIAAAKLKANQAKVQAHLEKAQEYLQQWDWALAEQELASAVKILPEQSEYASVRAKILEGRQNQQEAEQHLHQAQTHQKARAWDAALAEIEQALPLCGKLQPELEQLKRECQNGLKAEELMAQLQTLMAQGEWDNALAAMDKVAKLSGNYAADLEKLRTDCENGKQAGELLAQAQELQQAGKWDEAIAIAEKALALASATYQKPLEQLKTDCVTAKSEAERLAKEQAEEEARRLAEKQRREKLLADEKSRKAGSKMTQTVDGVTFTFCWCPAGSFAMGSQGKEKGREPNEKQHDVTLSRGFWILESEVTQRMWQAIMPEKADLSAFKGDDLPMDSVSWNDCQEFCRRLSEKIKLNVALPTEAQWEYACRAGKTGAYSGSYKQVMWYTENANKPEKETTRRKTAATPRANGTQPVKQKDANAWNLFDMHGNVREWCADWFEDGYYSVSPAKDPTGPKRGTEHVVRGGGWDCEAEQCRSAFRDKAPLLASGKNADDDEDLLDQYRSASSKRGKRKAGSSKAANTDTDDTNQADETDQADAEEANAEETAGQNGRRPSGAHPSGMHGRMPQMSHGKFPVMTEEMKEQIRNGQIPDMPQEMQEAIRNGQFPEITEEMKEQIRNGQIPEEMQKQMEQMQQAMAQAQQTMKPSKRHVRNSQKRAKAVAPVEFRQNNLGFRPILTVPLD